MKRETLKKILNFVITVLTAVASAFVCRAASSINPLKIQHYEKHKKNITYCHSLFSHTRHAGLHLRKARSLSFSPWFPQHRLSLLHHERRRHLPRRPESEIGAHARHFNAHSIGICYEGGLDADGNPADTRTKAQKQSLQNLLTSLCVDYPEAEILGHRDLPNVHKSCPCFSVQAWLNEIKFHI